MRKQIAAGLEIGTLTLALALLAAPFTAQARSSGEVKVTLLHVNDVHGHYRPEKAPAGLGGIARIKSAVSRVRSQTPNTLFIDGGDWSEGSVYYYASAHRDILQTMNAMGFDLAVVGNHDMLNGPDALLQGIAEGQPRFPILAANANPAAYGRADDFKRKIAPYVIREIDGAKIAFIGLVPYELIWDQYFAPVRILDPIKLTQQLSAQLRPQVDAIVVISHNSLNMNRSILQAAPEVDLVIGAHDHVKLTAPIKVARSGGRTSWLVEAGAHGHYLGRLDLSVGKGKLALVKYRLLQIDAELPSDETISARLTSMENLLERRYGGIFHDHVADTQIALTYDKGIEGLMGNITADAYRAALGTDIAIDNGKTIYGDLYPGALTTADIINANPGGYSRETGKAWTLRILPMKGRTLTWLLNSIYSIKQVSQVVALATSGLELTFKPTVGNAALLSKLLANTESMILENREEDLSDAELPANPVFELLPAQLAPSLMGMGHTTEELLEALHFVRNGSGSSANGTALQQILVNGRPLDLNATYRVAMSGGIVQSLRYLNSLIPNAVPLNGMRDTGKEAWRVLAEYLRSQGTITRDTVKFGRIRTAQPDLGVVFDDISWKPVRSTSDGMVADVQVTVRNYGASASGTGSQIAVLSNRNGGNTALDPAWATVGAAQSIPALAPGQLARFTWKAVPLTGSRGVFPVTARLSGVGGELNHANDLMTRDFRAARR